MDNGETGATVAPATAMAETAGADGASQVRPGRVRGVAKPVADSAGVLVARKVNVAHRVTTGHAAMRNALPGPEAARREGPMPMPCSLTVMPPRFDERPAADVEAMPQGRPPVDERHDDTAADTAQGAPVVATDQPVLPGLKPVLELLASDPARINTVFIRRGRRTPDTDRLMDLCREMRVRFSLLEGQVLDKLYAGGHQGVVARLFEAGYVELDDLLQDAPDAPLPLIIALDQVQDPGNAGTLARSLYALGGAGLIVPRHNAAYLGAGAHRAAAGALEKLPVARVANLAHALDEAAEAGYAIYGAMCGEGSVNAFTATLRTPCVLVLGNEDKGIRPNVAKRCDTLLHIPMLRDFDSFNVAQAGALLLGCFAAPLLRDR